MAVAGDETGGGERVSPRYANDLYYAHLSLYDFAARWAPGADVLDVGTGTGYGAAFLANRGARSVLGIDVDAEAVAFADRQFGVAGVEFVALEARHVARLGHGRFDLVVALNALEHIDGLLECLDGICGAMRPEAVLVAAVPPVTNATERLAELANPYHLHVWTPAQWRRSLDRYFGQLELWRHDPAAGALAPDFRGAPRGVRLRETDYTVCPANGDRDLGGTFSVVWVARRPRSAERRPVPGAPLEFVDDSVTRRPPRLTPLPPDLLSAPRTRWRAMPVRAWRIMVRRGPFGLAHEARSWLVWRARLALARRELARASQRAGRVGVRSERRTGEPPGAQGRA